MGPKGAPFSAGWYVNRTYVPHSAHLSVLSLQVVPLPPGGGPCRALWQLPALVNPASIVLNVL